jgi:hypothetical protein
VHSWTVFLDIRLSPGRQVAGTYGAAFDNPGGGRCHQQCGGACCYTWADRTASQAFLRERRPNASRRDQRTWNRPIGRR